MSTAILLLAGALWAETLAPDVLGQRVRALNREVATPILIAAVGLEAEADLRVALRGLPVRVVRAPEGGDPATEMAQALARAGLRCGLRVEPHGAGAFGIEPFGDCGSAALHRPTESPVSTGAATRAAAVQGGTAPFLPPPPAAPSAQALATLATLVERLVALPDHASRAVLIAELMVALAPDPGIASRLGQGLAVLTALDQHHRDDPSVIRFFLQAALDADPQVRLEALRAASSGGDPPRVDPDPALPTPATAPPPPRLLEDRSPQAMAYKDYHLKRLARGPTSQRFDLIGRAQAPQKMGWKWVVYRGQTRLSPTAFAREVGDRAMLARLAKDTRQAKLVSTLLFAAVGVAALGEIAVLATHGMDDNAFLVLPLTVIGPALPPAIVVPIKVRNDQQWVFNYYDAGKADRLIREHNEVLREELDLAPEQMRELDARE